MFVSCVGTVLLVIAPCSPSRAALCEQHALHCSSSSIILVRAAAQSTRLYSRIAQAIVDVIDHHDKLQNFHSPTLVCMLFRSRMRDMDLLSRISKHAASWKCTICAHGMEAAKRMRSQVARSAIEFQNAPQSKTRQLDEIEVILHARWQSQLAFQLATLWLL